MAMAPECLDLYVASNQQPFTYTMKHLLRKSFLQVWLLCLRHRYNVEKVARTSLDKIINTNTCLRTYLDTFVSEDDMEEEAVVFLNAFERRMTQNKRVWHAHYHHHKRSTKQYVMFPELEI